jgi:hypothetical protein
LELPAATISVDTSTVKQIETTEQNVCDRRYAGYAREGYTVETIDTFRSESGPLLAE